MKFIGRIRELKALEALKDKKSASLVTITGRRRIGKSRLVEEFGKKYTYYSFSGFPPTPSTTAMMERKHFALQLEKYFHVPLRYDNWYDLFHFLAKQTEKENVVILLDEISWMGSKDPEFLGTLKTIWDQTFSKNPNLVLVFCGSISSWIEKNILSSTGFLGRISLRLFLDELSLSESCQFFKGHNKLSPHEAFTLLSVTGGVPRYLEEINPKLTATENIRRLAFEKEGILFHEFDNLFSDLFMTRNAIYKKIVKSLVNSNTERNHIAKETELPENGVLTEYLQDLIQTGFINRDYSWHFKTNKNSNLSLFRISDNYIRFYLKYIDPNKEKILKNAYQDLDLSLLKNWNSIMGYQFENLVLKNRSLILEALNIKPESVIQDGPYFQRRTKDIPGCQIDYLIQTNLNLLYLIEIKFSKNPISSSVIQEVKGKMTSLKIPRNFSCRPILIHVNGITDDLDDQDYFTKIIDFSDFLK